MTVEVLPAATAIRQQREAVLRSAPLYVQACPGAGKTRVIVDRHLAGGQGASGRAVLSFTNIACDELTRRCREAGKPELAAFPNYIGTIDTFLWRYLVRPFLKSGRHWHRIDSWDRIDAFVEVGTGTNRHKVFLNDFLWNRDPAAEQCTAQLQRRKRSVKSYNALLKQGKLDEAALAAIDRRDDLARKGYVTGHEIRIMALRTLRQKHAEAIAILAGRFSEIVVDEAQDCSAHDLAILSELHVAGIPLVFVCDPDQAIYEFRGALPTNIRAFGAKLGSPVELTGNWRSSPAICGFAATLRPAAAGRPADVAVGPNSDEPAGVLLISASGSSQATKALTIFNDHADSMGITERQRVVLAHAGTSLPAATGASASSPPGNYSARVAWAAAVVKASNSSQRNVAYEILQRTLLRYWYDDTDHRSIEAICDSVGLAPWRLRQLAGQLAVALPAVDQGTFAEWCKEANDQLRNLPPKPGMTRLDRAGSLSAKGDLKDKTPREAGGAPSVASTARVRASNVHQFKGDEEDGVLVVVPSGARTDALVDAWLSGNHPAEVAENLRVLYVAATRARRLLAVALPADARTRLTQLLKEKNVPFDLATGQG